MEICRIVDIIGIYLQCNLVLYLLQPRWYTKKTLNVSNEYYNLLIITVSTMNKLSWFSHLCKIVTERINIRWYKLHVYPPILNLWPRLGYWQMKQYFQKWNVDDASYFKYLKRGYKWRHYLNDTSHGLQFVLRFNSVLCSWNWK